jgi:hypothetical protein
VDVVLKKNFQNAGEVVAGKGSREDPSAAPGASRIAVMSSGDWAVRSRKAPERSPLSP